MTDTQTMRAEFEGWADDNCIRKDMGAWDAWQAAWTRKPAAQVAVAEPKLGKLVPDSACKQGKCARPTTGCWDGCEMRKSYPFDGSYSVTIATFPAPEPDATKVVSVPVPWEERRPGGHLDSREEYMEAEIAEWRALAADRERT